MEWLPYVIAGLGVWAVARIATGLVLRALTRHAILDHPNERSSHSEPTPRGGGIAVIGVVVAAWAIGASFLFPSPGVAVILTATAPLAAISWLDDVRGLPVTGRLAAQVAVVAIGLTALPDSGLVFQGLLPPTLDVLAAGLLWLWFVNVFNFMDGIDGITGVETLSIGGGLALISLALDWRSDVLFYGLTLAAAALGFLHWNRHPARIFLGDVGSVPLGYLLGWLLLSAAAEGLWLAALLLPLYYLADATITLGRRMLRGERVWQAHRSHFYQYAARAAGSHTPVTRAILLVNLVLIALSLVGVAVAWAWGPSLFLGAAVVAILLWWFARQPA